MSNTYKIVSLKCPDGKTRRARRFKNGNAFVRVSGSWVKGRPAKGKFRPTGDGVNGNPFRA